MAKQKNLQESVIAQINEHNYDNLDAYLKNDVDWETISSELIQPKDVRKFVKKISNQEVQLDVMKFLHKYARQYFREAAEKEEYTEIQDDMFTAGPKIHIKNADERITLFQQELAFLIQQVEETGEFSGDRFSKLKKRIQELEEQVAKLQAANELLAHTIDVYEHPLRNGWSIPSELIESEFWHIIKYLMRKQMVVKHEERGVMGIPQVACYRWIHSHKGLFGYFADRVSYELDIYKNGHVQWKLFKQAFINYADVEKQAKDTISKYKSWAKPQAPLPTGYEIIDEAIKYAEEQMKKEQEKQKK